MIRALRIGALAGLLLGLALGAQVQGATVPQETTFRLVAGPRWIDRAAQIKAESLFKWGITARDGGMGGAQAMPRTWTWATLQGWVPSDASPYDPAMAILFNHRFMCYLEARTASLDAALGAYNAGLGSVRKAQLTASRLGLEGHDAWVRALPRVTGPANAAITTAYLARNKVYRAAIAHQVNP